MTVLLYKTKADPWLVCSTFPEVHVVQKTALRAFLVRLGGQVLARVGVDKFFSFFLQTFYRLFFLVFFPSFPFGTTLTSFSPV
jgi:hypothetical protein